MEAKIEAFEMWQADRQMADTQTDRQTGRLSESRKTERGAVARK